MRSTAERLVIRADASTEVGTGHVMRCLALGQAWKDAGGNVVFVTACQSEGLLQRLREEGFEVHSLSQSYPDQSDWDHTKRILVEHPDAWMVLDGYHFDEVYQRHVKETGNRLLVIDDMAHLDHYYADVVLNQNLHAEQLHYDCEPCSQLLLGTRYVLLRREFLAWKDWKRDIPDVARQILVTLGGSDPQNHTLKVMQALQEVYVPRLEVAVVIGASNPHADILQAAAKRSRIAVRLIHNADNMPELMAWADVAVSGGGTTAWELLFMGTPALFLTLANNQRYTGEYIEGHGLGKHLDQAGHMSTELLTQTLASLLKDSGLRARISQEARRIVNGQGAQQVVRSLHKPTTGELRLRPATFEDCRLLWEWANDPIVRASAFGSKSIPWDEHVNWCRQKLADPRCLLYLIISNNGIPVGQVRFDLNSEANAEVDISIAASERNKGYASAALRLACQQAAESTNVRNVLAHIKGKNIESVGAFRKAGFVERGAQDFKGHKTIEMIWEQGESL